MIGTVRRTGSRKSPKPLSAGQTRESRIRIRTSFVVTLVVRQIRLKPTVSPLAISIHSPCRRASTAKRAMRWENPLTGSLSITRLKVRSSGRATSTSADRVQSGVIQAVCGSPSTTFFASKPTPRTAVAVAAAPSARLRAKVFPMVRPTSSSTRQSRSEKSPSRLGGMLRRKTVLPPTERYQMSVISSADFTTWFSSRKNQPWRIDVLVSAGYQCRKPPASTTFLIRPSEPRSTSVMSGQCQSSGDPPMGMTDHSAGRVRPASLPHQRTSGPLPKITASGASLRIRSYHWP